MKKGLLFVLGLVVFAMVTACGGNDNSSNEEASNTEVDVEIQSFNWEFDQEVYTVSAGEVTIGHTNQEGHHGIGIEGTDISINGDGSQTAQLEPGEYRIYCNIPCGQGHADMVATLVVE
ncbi:MULTISPECIES: cytochrome C oxidase subunit II [Bacillaceae]|uniref:Cytochrome C oxidase subunit II n=1 Tax=Evansella alkalicola TaxID=745819 RepID=A0ABS6JRN6_9BACI|nr:MULTISPECIES: cytochrome C oxidase subunit II [Bacillaceae]MBU9721219.1 cytochrome C oxidase subunit II [Bacillus alkalicola]